MTYTGSNPSTEMPFKRDEKIRKSRKDIFEFSLVKLNDGAFHTEKAIFAFQMLRTT